MGKPIPNRLRPAVGEFFRIAGRTSVYYKREVVKTDDRFINSFVSPRRNQCVETLIFGGRREGHVIRFFGEYSAKDWVQVIQDWLKPREMPDFNKILSALPYESTESK